MDIGKRITKLREAKGISTNRLANLAGISQSYLRDVELGNKNPTVETLSYICFGLDVSLQAFFADSDQKIALPLMSALESLSQSEQIKLAEFLNAIKHKENK